MKTDIHPDYVEATVHCSCGNTFTTRSTKADLHVELCNECHPFFTGKQKLVDSGGRVERFQRRYGAQRKRAPEARRQRPRASTCPQPSRQDHGRARDRVRRRRGRAGRPGRGPDPGRLRDLSRRHKELGEIVRTWRELQQARADLETAREMLENTAATTAR